MKIILILVMAAALSAVAAEKTEKKSILESITISPVGVYQQAEFTKGPGQWGAGIDLSLPVNPFVSLHVRNLAFEGNDENTGHSKEGKSTSPAGTTSVNNWGGSTIDETAIYGRADFVKYFDEKLKLFGVGGGSRHWQLEDWSFHVGVGVEYNFSKHFSLSAQEEVRAFLKNKHDYLSGVSFNLRF